MMTKFPSAFKFLWTHGHGSAVANPGFSKGGRRQIARWGRQSIIWSRFSQKLHEKMAPLDPPVGWPKSFQS